MYTCTPTRYPVLNPYFRYRSSTVQHRHRTWNTYHRSSGMHDNATKPFIPVHEDPGNHVNQSDPQQSCEHLNTAEPTKKSRIDSPAKLQDDPRNKYHVLTMNTQPTDGDSENLNAQLDFWKTATTAMNDFLEEQFKQIPDLTEDEYEHYIMDTNSNTVIHLQGNGYKEAYACENPYLILHQYLSRFDLKAFTDFDDITYSGSLFQALITR